MIVCSRRLGLYQRKLTVSAERAINANLATGFGFTATKKYEKTVKIWPCAVFALRRLYTRVFFHKLSPRKYPGWFTNHIVSKHASIYDRPSGNEAWNVGRTNWKTIFENSNRCDRILMYESMNGWQLYWKTDRLEDEQLRLWSLASCEWMIYDRVIESD